MLFGHAFLTGLVAITGLTNALPVVERRNGNPITAVSVRSMDTTELVVRGNPNDVIPPVPILIPLAAAFFNAGRAFITALLERPFDQGGTTSPLNTQNAGATLLAGRVQVAVQNSAFGPLTVRITPIVNNTPFTVALTLTPYPNLNWAQIAQRAASSDGAGDGSQNLQRLVTQAVQRAITGNNEFSTYPINVQAQNQQPGQPIGFEVATLTVSFEGRSQFDD
ncbi:hypothetical protein B7463_g8946, partial [Scytalidium lignicola]